MEDPQINKCIQLLLSSFKEKVNIQMSKKREYSARPKFEKWKNSRVAFTWRFLLLETSGWIVFIQMESYMNIWSMGKNSHYNVFYQMFANMNYG